MFAGTDDFPMKLEVEAGMPQNCPPVSVGFGMAPIIDDKKTAQAGYEVYRDVEFVKIAIPGDRNSLYCQPATDKHKKRFPRAWLDFKSRDDSRPREGLPIENWAPISRATALNLKVHNIHTVEELEAVHDGLIEKLGSQGRELREKAKAFLSQAKDSAAITRSASEKEDLRTQIKALQNQIAAIQAGHVAKPGPAPMTASVPTIEHDDVEADVVAAARRPRKGQ